MDLKEALVNSDGGNANDAVDISELPSFTLNDLELVPEDTAHEDDEQSRTNLLKNNKRTVSFRWDLFWCRIKL